MKTTKFDIVDYLDSEEMIAEYLNTVLEDGDSSDLIFAIGHIAKSIGMTNIVEKTGMSRPVSQGGTWVPTQRMKIIKGL